MPPNAQPTKTYVAGVAGAVGESVTEANAAGSVYSDPKFAVMLLPGKVTVGGVPATRPASKLIAIGNGVQIAYKVTLSEATYADPLTVVPARFFQPSNEYPVLDTLAPLLSVTPVLPVV